MGKFAVVALKQCYLIHLSFHLNFVNLQISNFQFEWNLLKILLVRA